MQEMNYLAVVVAAVAAFVARACLTIHEGSHIVSEAMTTIAR